MNRQEEATVQFFQEHLEQERRQAMDSATSAATMSSPSPVTAAATLPVVDDNHITWRPLQIHCNLPFDKLKVLTELLVDFTNIAANGMDLREEMISQDWENYFARLHGPVYEKLVKDFWRQAECASHYVVSHVLGERLMITEKSIAQLLNLPHLGGKRILGKDIKSSFVKNTINKEIFTDFSSDKAKSLIPKLRIW